MKYRLSCKHFLSASHHNNKMSEIGANEACILFIKRDALSNTRSSLQARDGLKIKEVEVL